MRRHWSESTTRKAPCSHTMLIALFSLCTVASAQLGKDWTQATSATAWSGRVAHSSVSYGGRIWLIGGQGSNAAEEVWYTSDGTNWNLATRQPSWRYAIGASLVVFSGKMWLIGGRRPLPANDVWCSVDGLIWTTATLHAQWSPRYDQTSVVYNGKMWVLGGTYADANGSRAFRDAWFSTDGVKWTSATLSAPWASPHSSVVYNNRIWVICSEGVWNSSDGTSWTLARKGPLPWDNPPYLYIVGREAVVCDGKIWVMGGETIMTTIGQSDVWYTTDGKAWTRATPSAGWTGRVGHAVVVFDRKIWVLGGFAPGWKGTQGRLLNDVWYSAMPTPSRHWRLYP